MASCCMTFALLKMARNDPTHLLHIFLDCALIVNGAKYEGGEGKREEAIKISVSQQIVN